MSEPIPPFEDIFQEHKQSIYSLIYKALGHQEEAEDLTMQVFHNAYRNYSSFRGESSVSTWLYRIAVNALKNKIRWKVRQRKWFGFFQSLDQGEEGNEDRAPSLVVSDPSPPPLAAVELEDLKKDVRESVQGLSQAYREVIWLVVFQNLSYEEAAAALGISVSAVGVRLARAKKVLENKLKNWM